MKYRVTHTTKYTGKEPISVGHNEAWLRPRELPTQHCPSYELRIEPTPSIVSSRLDYFGNTVALFSFNQGYDELNVTAVSEVVLDSRPVTAGMASLAWDAIAGGLAQHATPDDRAALEFVFDSPRVRGSVDLEAYSRPSFAPGRPILEALVGLLAQIRQDFHYDPTATTITTPVEQVFQQRRGVCQDYAHLMSAMLRARGLAARYVSGYLRTYPPPGQARLVGADASHAWLSVYCGPLGWVDVDPTNQLLPNLDHITVAWGRDYGDVVPLKGVVIGGGSHNLQVSVDVQPIE